MTEGAAAVVGAAAVAGAAAIAGALALDTVADKSAAVTGTRNPVVPNASTTAEEGTDADCCLGCRCCTLGARHSRDRHSRLGELWRILTMVLRLLRFKE